MTTPTIYQVPVLLPGSVGIFPQQKYALVGDNLAAVTTAGYFNSSNLESAILSTSDILNLFYNWNPNTQTGTFEQFQVTLSGGVITLVVLSVAGDVVLPTVAGNIATYTNTTGQLSENPANGALTSTTTSSATPGTLRALRGQMVGTATTMTSGNIVGSRGEVDYVGASGGFVYGAQGKIIPTGTLSGSSWNAGVFGQLDISAATINAGQIAPIWGDYGASSGTLTNQTGCYGIAMTNTTAVVTIGQLYLYGGATNLMALETNAGLSGVTYFKNAGVSAGSWGNATFPTVSKVLTISVDGTTYYLPLVAQNT